MTNSWTDIRNTDLVVIMGGNAAEAHPCGFKWVTEAKARRGAKLIVVDPRFNRSASVSDYYAPIRPGSDIAFLMGVIRWCIENDKVQWQYVRNYTNASYLANNWYHFREMSSDHLTEQAVHEIDLANWFIGRLPKQAMGMLESGGRVIEWRGMTSVAGDEPPPPMMIPPPGG